MADAIISFFMLFPCFIKFEIKIKIAVCWQLRLTPRFAADLERSDGKTVPAPKGRFDTTCYVYLSLVALIKTILQL